MSTDAAAYAHLLRSDLFAFLQRCFPDLHGGRPLADAWHLEVLAATLERVRHGEIRRLVINLPPRHLKSILASVTFPAWCLGHDPAAQIVCISYGQDLADKHARDCRTIMNARWYRDLFGTTLSGHKVQELITTKGGVRLATSVGGGLTGRGGNLVIIDDPHKPDEILSETQRRATIDWYRNTLLTRVNDKATGAVILIMQRLHEEDLAGHVLAREGWHHLRLPAIAETEEAFEIETVFGAQRFVRPAGEALNPARESLETLARIRAAIGEYDFAGQYLQAPAPATGGMVKREWFMPYRAADVPDGAEVVQSWDTASKVDGHNDYSVCTTWAVVGTKVHLRHVLRERLEYPDLKRAVRAQQQLHRATTVLIEDKGSGTQLIQELRYEGHYMVWPYQSQLGKRERMYAQTAMIEGGFVFVPEAAPWLDAYLYELSVFPRGKKDDQADSTSQFLDWLKQRMMYSRRPLFGMQVRR